MKLGILPPFRANVASDPVWMTRFVQHAEAAGFESVYVVEHVAVPAGHAQRYPYSASGQMPLADDCEIPDPLELLAFLAGRTERIRLATGVLVAPHHHPLILAKRLATVDVLSGGRMLLGVGVGWMREELEATGVAFETRGRRLDEIIDAMRAVWSGPEPTYHGEFFDFDKAISRPLPFRSTGVPIHVGGHSPAAARRAGRVGDGFQPLGLDPELLSARLETMRVAAIEADRDPEVIELTLGAPLAGFDAATLDRLASQGADRILLSTAGAVIAEIEDQVSAAAELI